jgi:sugar O-acyltransferase (sialic acid O-acetyltransferase NeuD family)
MKHALIGSGGFAREIRAAMKMPDIQFFVDDKYEDLDNNILGLSKFNPKEYMVAVAIGDPLVRYNIIQSLPKETKYFTFIDPTVQIHDDNVQVGEGSIICAGTIITTNVKLGKHTHLNLLTTIGHDTQIGDYFTTAPGSKISGNCTIGDCVYVGTNSSIKEKIIVCSGVTIGSNATVVKHIVESGTYVGVPTKKIK